MKSLADPVLQRALDARLSALAPPDRALWGSMSVHQMICHMTEAFDCALGRKSLAPRKLALPRPILKFAALRVPRPWPHSFPSPPEIAQDQHGKPPIDFAQDHAALLAAFHEFCAYPPNPGPPHPYFGRMSTRDWLRWGYLHTDHHLRQFNR
ncbi:MAG TPA: DUF1569 domain-containing protein [Acidobacteriaceae bacterium]|jgi:hypothetical protein|nr:DUF1569 domain-containing protein [Acidobacteriaceae bacterium]